jgi:hypothetical protein
MNALPRFRHEWVRLITLPFKVYVLSAYLITSLYLALIPELLTYPLLKCPLFTS